MKISIHSLLICLICFQCIGSNHITAIKDEQIEKTINDNPEKSKSSNYVFYISNKCTDFTN
jgi:hypothetical protein